MIGLQAVIIAGVIMVSLGFNLQAIREQFSSTDRVITDLLITHSRIALLTDDYADLRAFVESIDLDGRLISLTLLDLGGSVVVATDRARQGRTLPVDAGDLLAVKGLGHTLGYLDLDFSDAPLLASFDRTRQLAVWLVLGGILIVAIAVLGSSALLTRRLAVLVDVADQVRAGRFQARTLLDGKDEIGRVGAALDSMLDRVQWQIRELRLARDRLILPTNALSQGFAVWDDQDRLILFNRRYRDFFGNSGLTIALGMHFEDVAASVRPLLVSGKGEERFTQRRTAAHRAHHGTFDLDFRDGRCVKVSESAMADGGVVAIYTDITEDKRRERKIADNEARLRAIMDAVGEAILTLDRTGRITSANAFALKLFERPEHEILNRRLDEILKIGSIAAAGGNGVVVDLLPAFDGQELVIESADGPRPIELSIRQTPILGVLTYIATVRDITERQRSQELIVHQATHDTLTGLANRALLDDRLEQALAQARRTGEILAVAFVDLDRFKAVNDEHGHAIGDRLLTAVAQRLRAAVRESDTIARMGGDEFVLVLRGLEVPGDAMKPTTKILEGLREPLRIDNHRLEIHASIGIAAFPAHGADREQLLKNADRALYRAKAKGRNRVEMFDASIRIEALAKRTIEKRLCEALLRDQFHLVYQPQRLIGDGRLIGLEALLRWSNPGGKNVGPSEFLPIAEECGLMGRISDRVLDLVTRDLAGWRERGCAPVRIGINMSARQIDDALACRLERVVGGLRTSGAAIDLELTEPALNASLAILESHAKELAAMGVSVTLDDFGAGHASINDLRHYPVDRIKIDRHYVGNLGTGKEYDAIARSMIELAQGLGKRVLAEGIETAEQLEILRGFRCDEGQGFLLGRPMDAHAIGDMLKAAA